DRTRQADRRRGTLRIDARIYVRRRRASGGEPLAGGRSGDSAPDAILLSRDVERKPATGGGLAGRADRDVEELAMVVALLLGGVRDSGRVEVSTALTKTKTSTMSHFGSGANNILATTPSG